MDRITAGICTRQRRSAARSATDTTSACSAERSAASSAVCREAPASVRARLPPRLIPARPRLPPNPACRQSPQAGPCHYRIATHPSPSALWADPWPKATNRVNRSPSPCPVILKPCAFRLSPDAHLPNRIKQAARRSSSSTRHLQKNISPGKIPLASTWSLIWATAPSTTLSARSSA